MHEAGLRLGREPGQQSAALRIDGAGALWVVSTGGHTAQRGGVDDHARASGLKRGPYLFGPAQIDWLEVKAKDAPCLRAAPGDHTQFLRCRLAQQVTAELSARARHQPTHVRAPLTL